MYEPFFGFSQRPFAAAPTARRFFPASSIDAARQTLTRAIDRAEGIGLVIGPPGIGKSVLLHVLAQQFRERFATVVFSAGQLETRRELLQAISFDLGLAYQNKDEGELRLGLVDYLCRSDKCPQGMLVLVDEAHVLPANVLEELRMMTNLAKDGEPRVRLVLAGTMRLEEQLAHPRLESFSQRLTARCYLDSFDSAETADFVRFQVAVAGGRLEAVFSPEAVTAVHRATDGVPRLINQICDQALHLAFTQGRRPVDARLIAAAWAELQQLPAPWHDTPEAEPIPAHAGVIEFGQLTDEPLGDGLGVDDESVLGVAQDSSALGVYAADDTIEVSQGELAAVADADEQDTHEHAEDEHAAHEHDAHEQPSSADPLIASNDVEAAQSVFSDVVVDLEMVDVLPSTEHAVEPPASVEPPQLVAAESSDSQLLADTAAAFDEIERQVAELGQEGPPHASLTEEQALDDAAQFNNAALEFFDMDETVDVGTIVPIAPAAAPASDPFDRFEDEEVLLDPYAALDSRTKPPALAENNGASPAAAATADANEGEYDDLTGVHLELSEHAEFFEVVVDAYWDLGTENEAAAEPAAAKEDSARLETTDTTDWMPEITPTAAAGPPKAETPPAPQPIQRHATISLSDAIRRRAQADFIETDFADPESGERIIKVPAERAAAPPQPVLASSQASGGELVIVDEAADEPSSDDTGRLLERQDYRQLFAKLKRN